MFIIIIIIIKWNQSPIVTLTVIDLVKGNYCERSIIVVIIIKIKLKTTRHYWEIAWRDKGRIRYDIRFPA